jgi:dethiobiotin synthetase
MKNNVYFVSGIDTDAGKSYATAWLARELMKGGESVITQKFIQTGNVGRSEDIELHRRIMGIPMQDVDREMLTMPEIFSYPASPLLASQIDGRPINFSKMEAATAALSERYDHVLLEGAGGLMVPLTEDLLTIDYIARRGYPLIFVTSGKLGSVNHTLLSFEAIRSRGIKLHTLAYNLFPHNDDMTISNDTKVYIKKYMEKYFPEANFIEVPSIKVVSSK